MKAQRFIIYGQVQGVGFRYYTKKKAEQYQIYGRVKNLVDGSVQVIAHTDSIERMNLFQAWLKQGPVYAVVDKIIQQEIAIDIPYQNFLIE